MTFKFYHSSLFLPQSKGLAVKQLEEDRVDLEQLRTRVGEDGRQIKQLEGLLENKDTEISRLTQVHMQGGREGRREGGREGGRA